MRTIVKREAIGAGTEREEGVVAVVVALVAVLLFVFGAFAVDLGAAYAERRSDQNSADASALAGANALPDIVSGGSKDNAIRDAVAFAEANLPAPPEGWSAAWQSCVDPAHLAYTNPSYGECVSVSAFDTRVRVVIPTREVPTALATAIGISSISVSALAEAQIEYAFGADVLPFAMTAASSGPSICIRAGPTSSQPCSGPADGNFGTLNFTHFGNAAMGTLLQCSGDMGNSGRLSRNIALGIDHALSKHPGPVVPNAASAGDRTDEDMCEAGGDHGSRPNATETQAGLRAQVLDESMLTEFSYMGRDIPGRLRQFPNDWPSTWPAVTIKGYSEDNRGLWSFMPQAGDADYAALVTAVPACNAAVVDTHAEMEACLTAHAAAPGAPLLFTRDENVDTVPDLLASPRFAWVPQLWETELTSGTSGPYHFQSFVPVFLESLRYDCKNNPHSGVTCTSWFAGETLPTLKGQPEEMTALVLSPSSLPPAVLESGPFTAGVPTVVLHK